jgi:hypothetical protein
MAPRKKAAKAAATAARAPPDPVVEDKPGDDDISRYPEVQQDEFLATQAIYPDDFVRVHGRKEAWKVSAERFCALIHRLMQFRTMRTSLFRSDFKRLITRNTS